MSGGGVSAADVEARLRGELGATDVQVHDLQGCGTSFEVHVVSPQFEGKRLLVSGVHRGALSGCRAVATQPPAPHRPPQERHKAVNAALAPLMPHIHALSIKKCKTPEEAAKAAA